MNTTTATAHIHTILCPTRTVTTTDDTWTTQSVEFACDTPTVDALLLAEREVRTHYVLAGFGADADTRARGEKNLKAARDAFWALVFSATPEVQAEFTARRLRIAA